MAGRKGLLEEEIEKGGDRERTSVNNGEEERKSSASILGGL